MTTSRPPLDDNERSVSFRRQDSSDSGVHEYGLNSHPPSPPPPTNGRNSPVVTPRKTSSTESLSPPVSPGQKRERRDSVDSTGSPKFNTPQLRSNLMRQQKDRDPLFYYEVVKTLGVGSMGSVARVKKRSNVIGGSARKDYQEAVRRQKTERNCLQIPFIGGLFRFCIDGELKRTTKENKKNALSDSVHSVMSTLGGGMTSSSGEISIPPPPPLGGTRATSSSSNSNNNNNPNSRHHSHDVTSSIDTSVTSNGSSGKRNDHTQASGGENNHKEKELLYAMKSIHLNRVTDNAFVTELKNEITILKELDHPHIVRALETFAHRNQIFIVMELCSGGDLYSRDPYKEEEAARIVSSILSAIAYMHSKGIAHRDLKYE